MAVVAVVAVAVEWWWWWRQSGGGGGGGGCRLGLVLWALAPLTNLTFWRSTELMNRFKNFVFGLSRSAALLPSPPPLAPAPPSSSDSSASASAAAAAMVAAACASSDDASRLRGCDQLILRMFGTFAGGSAGGSAAASGVGVGNMIRQLPLRRWHDGACNMTRPPCTNSPSDAIGSTQLGH